MSVEALSHFVFSFKSDVMGQLSLYPLNSLHKNIFSPVSSLLVDSNIFQWSYGVVLWEIFQCGALPYKSIKDIGLLKQHLLEHNRLEKPQLAPESV